MKKVMMAGVAALVLTSGMAIADPWRMETPGPCGSVLFKIMRLLANEEYEKAEVYLTKDSKESARVAGSEKYWANSLLSLNRKGGVDFEKSYQKKELNKNDDTIIVSMLVAHKKGKDTSVKRTFKKEEGKWLLSHKGTHP